VVNIFIGMINIFNGADKATAARNAMLLTIEGPDV
jgi:hypothetical protein